jgi:hypothetical protein
MGSKRDCSGCFRLERSPGGTCTHWKSAAFPRRTPKADVMNSSVADAGNREVAAVEDGVPSMAINQQPRPRQRRSGRLHDSGDRIEPACWSGAVVSGGTRAARLMTSLAPLAAEFTSHRPTSRQPPRQHCAGSLEISCKRRSRRGIR